MTHETTIRLKGMRFYAYHGYYPEEQVFGNWFEVDVSIGYPEQHEFNTDDLDAVVNYEVVHQVCQSRMERTVKLIETLAAGIAADLQGAFPDARSFTVLIRKKHPPLTGPVNQSEIEYKLKK